nr:immunoglobulin light chain junction region [Macaca mulatta]MPN67562.1 immunoglobulin light chain junction region [Macaca mulatta]MPN68350.1 immunoglobulin light chain junction region [Macaca mulatta]
CSSYAGSNALVF